MFSFGVANAAAQPSSAAAQRASGEDADARVTCWRLLVVRRRGFWRALRPPPLSNTGSARPKRLASAESPELAMQQQHKVRSDESLATGVVNRAETTAERSSATERSVGSHGRAPDR